MRRQEAPISECYETEKTLKRKRHAAFSVVALQHEALPNILDFIRSALSQRKSLILKVSQMSQVFRPPSHWRASGPQNVWRLKPVTLVTVTLDLLKPLIYKAFSPVSWSAYALDLNDSPKSPSNLGAIRLSALSHACDKSPLN